MGEKRRQGPWPPPARQPRPPPRQTLTGLGERLEAALCGQPVETAETRRWRGLVLPVQVAVVPEAACEEEEPAQDPECDSLASRGAKALCTSRVKVEISCRAPSGVWSTDNNTQRLSFFFFFKLGIAAQGKRVVTLGLRTTVEVEVQEARLRSF